MREFHSFGEAARHLVSLHVENQHGAMEDAAKLVEAEAKGLIGHYQGAEPPFEAWPELAESTKAGRVAQGFSENDPLLRTGEMRDSIDHVAAHDMAVVGSNLDKAVFQELGTVSIPPRSFLGMAAMKKGPDIANILGRSIVGMMVGQGPFVRKIVP